MTMLMFFAMVAFLVTHTPELPKMFAGLAHDTS